MRRDQFTHRLTGLGERRDGGAQGQPTDLGDAGGNPPDAFHIGLAVFT